jgi:hypothetical protein
MEYTSDVDEEDSDEDDVVGVAGLALAKPESLFKYDYTKDYESSTKNTPHKCLMAKEAKVILSSQPSCPINDDMDEETILATLYKTMCSLRGDARAHFEYLMDTIAQRNESLEEARSHVEDRERRFNLLAQELTEEKNTSLFLSQQIETYQLDKTKDLDTMDKTLLMAQELDASKKELEVAHASLTKDLEHLKRANKLVKDELNRLSKKYEELQAIHNEVQGSSSMPIIFENIACVTNSSLDQATLIEENAKLKAQLEKERLASLQLGKPPHEIFAQQKERPRGQGLGFNPRNNNNYVIPPKKINFVKEGYKENGNGKKDTMGGNVNRGNPNHSFVGKTNPSYVLCKDTYGSVFARYVGPRDGYAYRWYSIWVPKSLVANVGVPLPNGLLNPRIDFVVLFLRWAKVVV